MKFAFYFCTKDSKPNDTLAYKSLSKINPGKIFYTCNNKEGLSKRYNEFIDKNSKDFDYIIFLHDDVFVDDYNICEKLVTAHTEFDIVGLAGGINPVVQKPALWHLMCGGFGPNLRGFVAHYANEKQYFVTNFGLTPSRVTVLDGLFLSVSTDAISHVNGNLMKIIDFTIMI